MEFIIKILLNAFALFIAAKFLRGVQIQDFTRAIIVALVIAVLNATLGSFLKFASLGLLWVFSFILDAIIILVADYFLKGLRVKNFWWALILAVCIALVNFFTYSFFGIG